MAVTVSNDHLGKRLAQRPDTTMKQSLRKVITVDGLTCLHRGGSNTRDACQHLPLASQP